MILNFKSLVIQNSVHTVHLKWDKLYSSFFTTSIPSKQVKMGRWGIMPPKFGMLYPLTLSKAGTKKGHPINGYIPPPTSQFRMMKKIENSSPIFLHEGSFKSPLQSQTLKPHPFQLSSFFFVDIFVNIFFFSFCAMASRSSPLCSIVTH